MFDKLLIANRGEIACRVMRTCRRLGIASVAVYSDADRHALHVRLAEEAVHIGPAPAAESYLRIDRIVAAARASGAAAVHPGYGFLAENPAFAGACAEAGLAFVGPLPATIEKMGSKSAARRLMQAAGVPVVPGFDGHEQDDRSLAREAERLGFPLMIKPSAGGGGKGMRIVRDTAGFAAALKSARREALSAFGDDRVLLERYLEEPRHIEIQVFGDEHGNVVHLFERECSIQRRYQKIIEETPSPFADEALATGLGAAAVTAARAVDYRNAGTVEFIVGADREFYFMEMNTRLQVEHPVTELVTGLDLVEWQLRVAAGEPLPLGQQALSRRGHAIEARIYAEDPAQDFLPAVGRIDRFAHPPPDAGLRIDAGIEDGDRVGIHYDPMIAKLCVHAADRAAAVTALRRALARTAVFGPATNLGLLRRIAAHPAFAAGQIHTGWLDAELGALLGDAPEAAPVIRAAAAVRCLLDREAAGREDAEEAASPWNRLDGWQANGLGRNRLRFADETGRARDLFVTGWHGRYRVADEGRDFDLEAREVDSECLEIDTGGQAQTLVVIRHGNRYVVADDMAGFVLEQKDPWPVAEAAADDRAHPGAPLPGRIVAVEVAAGDRVVEGQPLLVLEGMKMEYTLRARAAGVVERVLYAAGEFVEAEVALVDIRPDGDETA
ncbi:MAG TPA: biotin carboxylase N-terminal domain-containing protein [Gammaproteobacteria bacterium]|nr:biotin carboxylase N-terminal domain-containing protein [Gammaproteobacteria bacterium]